MAYAQRPATASPDVNYILTAPDQAPPPGAVLRARNEAGAVFVISEELWQRHRDLRPATPAGARVYHNQRGILFRSVPLKDGPWILDLPAVLGRLGVDVEALVRRLGVER
jgi:hypothetical protein